MYKVALWGAGDGYNVFVANHGLEMVEVVAIADKLAGLYKSIDNIPVVAPNELISGNIKYDYLIVTVVNENTYKEIVNIAVAMGIRREIILPARIFHIPFFNFEDYIKIKNSNISILSDTCFAGFVYHRFGMKFLTPTINMFTDNENYYTFLSNLKENMTYPMVKQENTLEDLYLGIYSFPQGRVGNSKWNFNHDIEFETAAARWERGRQRFNWDNYMATMTIRSDEMAYKFDALPIENKIGFYWKELGLKSVVCIPEWNNSSIRAKFEYNFTTFVNQIANEILGVKSINWMKALLHESDYKRIEGYN